MTNVGSIILILISVGIGYVIEPVFFSGSNHAKHEQAKDATEDPSVDVEKPTVTEVTEPEIEVDLSKITNADFPEKVTLKVPYTIKDAASGITMTLKKGSKVKPLRLDGHRLAIQPIGFPVKGMINVDHTDFKKLALPLMLKRLQNPVVKKDPEPVPPTPEPTPAPAPTPAPEPAPTPEPAPVVEKKLDEAAIVALMKASVTAGKVTEFKAAQVTHWKAGDEMDFDGETYQTGRVTFKAETILGVQKHDAIALIEDGKIYKWMWAKTKLEMR